MHVPQLMGQIVLCSSALKSGFAISFFHFFPPKNKLKKEIAKPLLRWHPYSPKTVIENTILQNK
jgi:hypothetical protein